MPPCSSLAALIAALCLVASAAPAAAHALLQESAPAADGTVPAGHEAIRLRFNSRIDAARSRVTLAGPDGAAQVVKLAADRPDLLTGAADLAPGAYVLHWQVLAIDGHITRGEVRFTVAPAGSR